MARVTGEPLGPPTSAKPLGSNSRKPVVSPGRIAINWPEREYTATERFERDPTEEEDDGPDFTWTPRHERVPGL